MKHYNTIGRIKAIAILAAVAAAAVIWTMAGIRALQGGTEPDAVYPMANQHIEWTWAGKDGAGK